MTYAEESKIGRDHAKQAIADCSRTGNVPRLVRTIRDAAKDEGGYGVGFLFTLSGEVAK